MFFFAINYSGGYIFRYSLNNSKQKEKKKFVNEIKKNIKFLQHFSPIYTIEEIEKPH